MRLTDKVRRGLQHIDAFLSVQVADGDLYGNKSEEKLEEIKEAIKWLEHKAYEKPNIICIQYG